MERHSSRIVTDDLLTLCGNCAFLQNFHTRKTGEITVFFAMWIIKCSTLHFFQNLSDLLAPVTTLSISEIKVMNAKSMLEVTVSESNFSLKEYAGDVIIKKPLVLLYLHKFFQ